MQRMDHRELAVTLRPLFIVVVPALAGAPSRSPVTVQVVEDEGLPQQIGVAEQLQERRVHRELTVRFQVQLDYLRWLGSRAHTGINGLSAPARLHPLVDLRHKPVDEAGRQNSGQHDVAVLGEVFHLKLPHGHGCLSPVGSPVGTPGSLSGRPVTPQCGVSYPRPIYVMPMGMANGQKEGPQHTGIGRVPSDVAVNVP